MKKEILYCVVCVGCYGYTTVEKTASYDDAIILSAKLTKREIKENGCCMFPVIEYTEDNKKMYDRVFKWTVKHYKNRKIKN